ncbi:uncharacterized protein LOC129570751 isoform X1 [Sitodiplosis mosellana]|uniref:uncharacterized protein LOC129570751 isoform X1 n=2 Tax=Sitodiplosis mosellana TaxID=263140 RepID=UPI002444CA07|nr:uncharacterized protein LOC129570751 isoform X1 [Sitodiplosis mosellana]
MHISVGFSINYMNQHRIRAFVDHRKIFMLTFKMVAIPGCGHPFVSGCGHSLFSLETHVFELESAIYRGFCYLFGFLIHFYGFLAMSTAKKSTEPKAIDVNALVKAIKDCLIDKMQIKTTARSHDLPRSSLQRYLKKVEENYEDLSAVADDELTEFVRDCGQRTPSNMVFTTAQEKELVDYILKCVNHYYGLSITELRELAYQLVKKLAVDYPANWDEEMMAGRHWYYNFMRHHRQLVLRTPEQTSLNRAKAFSKTNVDKFCKNCDTDLDDEESDE